MKPLEITKCSYMRTMKC